MNDETRQITYEHYGCCKCQHRHFEDEAIFKEHIYFQSKHGIQTMGLQERIECEMVSTPEPTL